MIAQRNRIASGLLYGLLMPAAVLAVLFGLFGLLDQGGLASGEGLANNFRIRTLALAALAVNLWLIRIFRRRRWEEAMRGVVIATGLYALGWVIYFLPGMF
jgi:hypothetical protein